jgi:hypothetical protein
MRDFLADIGFLTDSERKALIGTGAETPLALESTLLAGSEAYERFLGESHFRDLIEALDRMIAPGERTVLRNVAPTDNPVGVPVDESPPTIVRSSEHEARDRIYVEIRRLKRSSHLRPEEKERLKRLEDQLIQLLEDPAA